MSEAARRDHFPDIRVVRFCGEGGAGAEENREDEPPKGSKAWKFVADPALKKNVSPQASATLTALKKRYRSLQGAVDAGWRFVDGDGVDVKPGKMSGPLSAWKSTSELRYSTPSSRHGRGENVGIATPSSRRSYGDNIASMA